MNQLIISKKNLINNIEIIKKHIKSGVKVCAMVKANAYGHGIGYIPMLIQNDVDYFGVANVTEGIILRKAGITKPILVVGYTRLNEIKKASKYDISISIFKLNELVKIKQLNIKIKIHLKVNTGMNRFGIKDIEEFLKCFELFDVNLVLAGVYTHFACGNSICLKNQNDVFLHFIKCISKEFKPIIHASSSSGVFFDNLYNYDMVRSGLSIYGYCELDMLNELKPVLKITSKIIDIQNIDKGESVGYNFGYIAKKNITTATVDIGYYDGVNRLLKNKVKFLLGNNRVKLIGNVCMDFCMIDVTGIPAKIGDTVTVLENAEYWAALCKTIPYEILTNIKSDRMKVVIDN